MDKLFHGVIARSEWFSAHHQRGKLRSIPVFGDRVNDPLPIPRRSMVISITRIRLVKAAAQNMGDFDAFDGEGGNSRGGIACSMIKLPR